MSSFHTLEQLGWCQPFWQLDPALYRLASPQGITQPKLIHANDDVAQLIGLDPNQSKRAAFLRLFSGHTLLKNMQPLAMKYAGHQFGVYNPALGDGRGLLLGQVNHQQSVWDIHLKGAGKTPYSRQGDGRAVLRASIREYLCSEAMHHLGIATTRALCLIDSSEPVMREEIENAATLARVSQSHVRFGHFEYLYHSNQHHLLAPLSDTIIKQHFPEVSNDLHPYLSMFNAVVAKTATLIAQWQAIGFCHGVMNTDNMSIIGQTLDYGPFAFLDQYQADYVCNASDYEGRYAFNRQPDIAQWNLSALALALTPLVCKNKLNQALAEFEPLLIAHYRHLMLAKLGLSQAQADDGDLIRAVMRIIADQRLDYTLFWRHLSHAHTAKDMHFMLSNTAEFDTWFTQYSERSAREPSNKRQQQQRMQANNPKYILRNHLVQRAIELAQTGDYSEVVKLFDLLQHPYAEQPEFEQYSLGPSDARRLAPLSCSS
ncbi:protein adenylyltransferase SelO [Motilimonas pumila]|uniref:Protein nucleotidyltransferase YdiU n=1 Tax=Motilimonas pumila TaxID=2303987 RepID=A0A418YK22_9GAMM|nr:YdiU family protein [Motilimonas pumila]RJG51315.1 YdiU family protein [Motilimonas pumila]